jgi:hypothetical protein
VVVNEALRVGCSVVSAAIDFRGDFRALKQFRVFEVGETHLAEGTIELRKFERNF